jgi:hypothetical protein
MDFSQLRRRDFVSSAGLLGIGTLMLPEPAHSSIISNLENDNAVTGPYLDLRTAEGSMLSYARLQGNLDTTKTKYLWFSGNVMGVRNGEKTRDLFRVEGMTSARLEPLPGGGYMRLLREVGYYVDPISRQVMDEWTNTYTGESVKVVHIINDPFNFKIEKEFPEPPSFGGQNKEKPPRRPFILPWEQHGAHLNLDLHIHLNYPSPLQPDKWPRESHGPMTRASEIFMNQVSAEDMQNEGLTTVNHTGTWTRMTPWLPWMLMDQVEGHIVYSCFKGTGDSLDAIPKNILDYTAKHYPKFLEAPKVYEEPSLSSLEHYAEDQIPSSK